MGRNAYQSPSSTPVPYCGSFTLDLLRPFSLGPYFQALLLTMLIMLDVITKTSSYNCGGTVRSCGGIATQSLLAKNPNSSHLRTLHEILDNYESHLRPTFNEGTFTTVNCDVYVNSVDSISVDTMDFAVNIYMRQRWRDPRLAYKHIANVTRFSLDHKLFDEIWVPDLFFPNEKHSNTHCVTVPNAMIRISPEGDVLYSARYTLRLACHMDLHRFPLDKQQCHMRIESYGYTVEEIKLHWFNDTPVQINENLELPQFDLTGYDVGECTSSYIVGSFACLQATFYLRRQYGYYMIQTYVPSILIVVLSWVSFWINIDAVPARISLGVLTVLTLTTQSVGVWMSLPRVSYVKAIDIWMAMCIIMVFTAMLEFAIVNTYSRKEVRRMSMKEAKNSDGNVRSEIVKRMMDEITYGSLRRFDANSRMIARRVDKMARWFFPSVFILFNIVYWCFFLID